MELKELSERLDRIMVMIRAIGYRDDVSVKIFKRLIRIKKAIIEVSILLTLKDF